MSDHQRIHDLPPDQKPREKMAALGVAALSNEELLAIFLRTGTKGASAIEIGRQLLRKHGSIVTLARLDLQELCKEHGLGLAKACQLQAAFELGSRAARDDSSSVTLTSSDALYNFLAPQLAHLSTEKLFVLTLHGNGKLIRMRELSSGSSNQTVASISEILRPVLIDKAPNFAIAHNHPSGETTPSIPDKTLTKNLTKAAHTMGLTFIDHIIIGRPNDGTQGYYSFMEEGEI
ncbi:MAG: DNA repair protein RadC [Akkermansiaceae bacterium]|jgi:DNA repair protein RadC|tara:strand:+ start:2929 stop:3627 length:699 start_codon:yes stop_codon:yes gene_type:complete